jgi:phosphoribosyl-ATP pyrophosphohydrolase
MRSVADELREQGVSAMQKLTPDQRVRLALRLGEQAIEIYMAANHVDREAAIAAFRRTGNAGRVPSRSNDES